MCKCGSDRIISVNAKCSDCCSIQLPSGEEVEGYIPGDLNIGGGDYVEFEFCMDCGLIQGQFPIKEEPGCGEEKEEKLCPCPTCGKCCCGNEHCAHWDESWCEC